MSVEPVWKHVHVEASADEEFTRGIVRGKHELLFDESTELPIPGQDKHPSAVDHLVTSLVVCQVSVLEQCFEKARIEAFEIEAEATIDNQRSGEIPEEMPENTAKRVEHILVNLEVSVPGEFESRARRCVEVYDQGCIVGQSFRAGISYTPNTTLTVTSEAAD